MFDLASGLPAATSNAIAVDIDGNGAEGLLFMGLGEGNAMALGMEARRYRQAGDRLWRQRR